MKRRLRIVLVFACALLLSSTALVQQANASPGSVPAEYVGKWAGDNGDIRLSFDISANGTGTYIFDQRGYHESGALALTAETGTFTMEVPEDNQLNAESCVGTYTYANGVLTVGVKITFAGGRVFQYSVPCERVAPADATPMPALATDIPPEYVGEWVASERSVNLSIDIRADGTGVYIQEQEGSEDHYPFTMVDKPEGGYDVLILPDEELDLVASKASCAYTNGALNVYVKNTYLSGGVFEYTVDFKRVETATMPLQGLMQIPKGLSLQDLQVAIEEKLHVSLAPLREDLLTNQAVGMTIAGCPALVAIAHNEDTVTGFGLSLFGDKTLLNAYLSDKGSGDIWAEQRYATGVERDAAALASFARFAQIWAAIQPDLGELASGCVNIAIGSELHLYDLPMKDGQLDMDVLQRILLSDWEGSLGFVLACENDTIFVFSLETASTGSSNDSEEDSGVLFSGAVIEWLPMPILEEMGVNGFSAPDGEYPLP